jgi:hypothetical protein
MRSHIKLHQMLRCETNRAPGREAQSTPKAQTRIRSVSAQDGRCPKPVMQWSDDLGPLHGDPVPARGNLAYAFGQRGDRRSHAIGDAARSRAWVDTIVKDPAADIGTIAKRENLAERHARFLAPLAYLSPRIIEAIAEGQAPAGLTVTRLVPHLPTVWADQEKQLGFA